MSIRVSALEALDSDFILEEYKKSSNTNSNYKYENQLFLKGNELEQKLKYHNDTNDVKGIMMSADSKLSLKIAINEIIRTFINGSMYINQIDNKLRELNNYKQRDASSIKSEKLVYCYEL